MAKGSVRKKGKKWYYRFYVEDESGRQVQREFAGTESSNNTKTALSMANCSASTTILRLRRKTVHTMRSIRYRETRRFPRDTKRYPLYA